MALNEEHCKKRGRTNRIEKRIPSSDILNQRSATRRDQAQATTDKQPRKEFNQNQKHRKQTTQMLCSLIWRTPSKYLRLISNVIWEPPDCDMSDRKGKEIPGKYRFNPRRDYSPGRTQFFLKISGHV